VLFPTLSQLTIDASGLPQYWLPEISKQPKTDLLGAAGGITFLTAVYRLEKKTQIHAPLTHPHSSSEMRTGERLNPCEASARGSD